MKSYIGIYVFTWLNNAVADAKNENGNMCNNVFRKTFYWFATTTSIWQYNKIAGII